MPSPIHNSLLLSLTFQISLFSTIHNNLLSKPTILCPSAFRNSQYPSTFATFSTFTVFHNSQQPSIKAYYFVSQCLPQFTVAFYLSFMFQMSMPFTIQNSLPFQLDIFWVPKPFTIHNSLLLKFNVSCANAFYTYTHEYAFRFLFPLLYIKHSN